MEILEIILKLLAILGGLATPVFFVVFFKYNKRIKKNEADIEAENNIHKRALNSQVECQIECDNCPILIKYKLLISKK